MGNRCYLSAYIPETYFSEDEKKYYKMYKTYDGSQEKFDELSNYVLKVNEDYSIWNTKDYEEMMQNHIPSCNHISMDGVDYFTPDYFSKNPYNQVCDFEKKDFVPDSYLSLFKRNNYIDKITLRDVEYSANRLIANVSEIKENFEGAALRPEQKYIIDRVFSLPDDALVILDFSEVIQSEDCPFYKTLDEYLRRVPA